MQRREFLAASTAAAIGLASGQSATAQEGAAQAASQQPGDSSGRQLIELRNYHFASAEKRDAFARFLGEAMVPALDRAGVKPVGVFTFAAKDNPDLKTPVDANDLFVVLPHESAQSFLDLSSRIVADQSFLQAGLSVLLAPKSDPAFTRYESSLFRAFATLPRVLSPAKGSGRVAQLRIYESHSSERGAKKIQMFEEGGEIDIFKRVGLNPVFFGQGVAGARLPNLTYMLAFDDEKAMKAGWDKFRGDPEWKKLSADEEYKDTVSNITNLVLRPVEGSQI